MNEAVSFTQTSYRDDILLLFGILSSSAKEKENCHFCLNEITKNEPHTMDTPCCNHAVHCACFDDWKTSQRSARRIKYTTPCAYCRAQIPEPKYCFLCLDTKTDQPCEGTPCCNSPVHSLYLKNTFRILPRNAFLECGFCSVVSKHDGKTFVKLE